MPALLLLETVHSSFSQSGHPESLFATREAVNRPLPLHSLPSAFRESMSLPLTFTFIPTPTTVPYRLPDNQPQRRLQGVLTVRRRFSNEQSLTLSRKRMNNSEEESSNWSRVSGFVTTHFGMDMQTVQPRPQIVPFQR